MEAVTRAVSLVVLDNTVLSNFALVERSELLSQLWGDAICTTQAVLAEYARGVASGVVPAVLWNTLAPIEFTQAEQQFAADLSLRLGAGERTCLAAAYLRRGLLVTDDRRARTLARRLGVSVTGTIGVLVRLVRDGRLTHAAADMLLANMISAGFRSPIRHLDEAMPDGEER